jgi:GTPase
MKRLGLLLTATALLIVAVTAHTAYSEDAELAGLKKDIQKILTRQDEILKAIEDLKSDVNIVKIRCSG